MSPKRALIPNSADKSLSRSHAGGSWRIRIIKPPAKDDSDLHGLDLPRMELGKVYEVGPRLAELLIVCGYAAPEMPQHERAADQPTKRKTKLPKQHER